VDGAVEIRAFGDSDLEPIVALSLRAWEPVFESMRSVLGDPIFDRLHRPDWQSAQSDAVRSSCTSDGHGVFVAVVDDRPVGFATVALNAFHERMGVIDMLAVDPAFQRRGIARQLITHSIDHMRASGMDIAAVGTGGDAGHGPARAAYEALGFTPLPGVRYLKLLPA
jgi:GNAT superfamily N-acetyltransferase